MTGAGERRDHRIVVVGGGVVGARVARELLTPLADGSVPGVAPVLLTRRPERRTQLADSFGRDVAVRLVAGSGADVIKAVRAPSTAVVVIARASGEHLEIADAAVTAGRHVVSTSDDPAEVAGLLAVSGRAREMGVSVVAGAAFSPGWSCLLASHASGLLDVVDEIHVARHGAAGPACARQRLAALRGTATEWRDGEWVTRPGFSGRELLWFPDPIDAKDCHRAELAEPALLVPAFPGVQRVTARLAANRRDRALAPFPVWLPPPGEGGIGAIRVELRGAVDGERSTVVYGALDRPAIAAGAVAAVTALRLGGVLPDAPGPAPGATGLAGAGAVLATLHELARRGVRAATFVGDEHH